MNYMTKSILHLKTAPRTIFIDEDYLVFLNACSEEGTDVVMVDLFHLKHRPHSAKNFERY